MRYSNTFILVLVMLIIHSTHVQSYVTKEQLSKKFTIIFVGDSITAGIGTYSRKRAFPGLITYVMKEKYPMAKVISNGAGWRTV